MTQLTQDDNDLRWHLLRSKIQRENLKKAFQIFRENGIEPILIKGWAAAEYYPPDTERLYADIDLCVDPKQFQTAQTIAETADAIKLSIDLHNGLRHFDTVSWEDLFENSTVKKIDGTEIRVLRAEDHLRVLCVHWLTDGGAYKEKLWDIFYAVQHRSEDFDWNRCLQVVDEKRRKWIVYTIGLASKYLALNLSGTPIENEAKHLPKWLTTTVEREWKSEVKLKPLQTCLNDKKELMRQIWLRLPPNPIQSTVELEGSFDKNLRIFYQLGAIFKRVRPSFRRIREVLQSR